MIHPSLRFITSRGSQYFQFPDGRWVRKKYDNTNEHRAIYLGSINPSESRVYRPERGSFSTDLDQEVLSGLVSGFTPEFIEGNHPLGIVCDPGKAFFDEKSGRIILPKRKLRELLFGRQLDYHLGGDKITEVF